MGKFDNQLAHWREQHRIALEDLEALLSGERKMAEDNGDGWIDVTDRNCPAGPFPRNDGMLP
jgi:hypothetical protein